MKILFLDDDPARHAIFAHNACIGGHNVTHVTNINDFVEAFSKNGPFDAVWLDHDLNDFGSDLNWHGGEHTGTDAAHWMAHNVLEGNRPKQVVIHSFNPHGAQNMAHVLNDAGFRGVVRAPFSLSVQCDRCGHPKEWMRDAGQLECLNCKMTHNVANKN